MLAFTSETMKHSAGIAIATGEFVFNLCTRPLFEAMNISSGALASGESEFEAAGLATAPSRIVNAPRVAASPAALECRVVHSMRLHDVDGKPVGLVFVGVAHPAGCEVEEHQFRGQRADIRRRATQAALVALRKLALAE